MIRQDKIRILWIQDTTDIPTTELPVEYQDFFEVVTKTEDGEIYPIYSFEWFKEELDEFWDQKNIKKLPAEIMAVDYDLSKAPPLDNGGDNEEPIDFTCEFLPVPPIGEGRPAQIQSDKIDFDGLLIGIFWGTLTRNHPIGFVPITYFQNEMPASVSHFQDLTQNILGIDFNFSGTERTWENIIDKGVYLLRNRMKELCKERECIFSLRDLLALATTPNHNTITFRSPYTERTLPISGLFIDIKDPKQRQAEIACWSQELIGLLSFHATDIQAAHEAADLLWEKYCDDVLFKKRVCLSESIVKKEKIPEELKKCFGYDKHKKKLALNCLDIRRVGENDQTRRLAALFTILLLFERCILTRKKIKKKNTSQEAETTLLSPEMPILTVDDFYLALFPVPDSPCELPWHRNKKIDKSHGWSSALMNWDTGKKANNRYGNLALSLEDVLHGKEWNPENDSYGVTDGERHLLRCMVFGKISRPSNMQGKDSLSLEDWKGFFAARRLLKWRNEHGA